MVSIQKFSILFLFLLLLSNFSFSSQSPFSGSTWFVNATQTTTCNPAGQPHSNDRPNVQAAIDAASPNDKIIICKNGTQTYLVTSFNITKRLLVMGNDSSMILNTTAGDNMININASNSSVSNLTIIGGAFGIRMFNGPSGIVLENITAYNFSLDIIFFDDNSENNSITNVTAYGASPSASGFRFDPSTNNITVTNSAAFNNTYDGFLLTSSSRNIFSNVQAYSNQNHGLDATLLSNNNTIINSSFYSNSQSGISFADRGGNNISNSLTYLNVLYGIDLNPSGHNLIFNLSAFNNTLSGFELISAPNNLINMSNSYFNRNSGFILDSLSTNNSFTNSNSYNNSNAGINVVSAANITIRNSSFNYNAQQGIYLQSTPDSSISNNTMLENTQIDFYLTPSSDIDCNIIAENNTGSGINSIYFTNSSNISASLNTTVSEIILCNADDSHVLNATVDGSVTKKNNGVFLFRTTTAHIYNITSLSNYYGFLLSSSSGTNISNSTATNNSLYGIYLTSSSIDTITNSRAFNNTYGVYVLSSIGNNFTNVTSSFNSQIAFAIQSGVNTTILNSSANGNQYGFYATTSNLTALSCEISNSSAVGFNLYSSFNSVLANTTFKNSSIGFNFSNSNLNITGSISLLNSVNQDIYLINSTIYGNLFNITTNDSTFALPNATNVSIKSLNITILTSTPSVNTIENVTLTYATILRQLDSFGVLNITNTSANGATVALTFVFNSSDVSSDYPPSNVLLGIFNSSSSSWTQIPTASLDTSAYTISSVINSFRLTYYSPLVYRYVPPITSSPTSSPQKAQKSEPSLSYKYICPNNQLEVSSSSDTQIKLYKLTPFSVIDSKSVDSNNKALFQISQSGGYEIESSGSNYLTKTISADLELCKPEDKSIVLSLSYSCDSMQITALATDGSKPVEGVLISSEKSGSSITNNDGKAQFTFSGSSSDLFEASKSGYTTAASTINAVCEKEPVTPEKPLEKTPEIPVIDPATNNKPSEQVKNPLPKNNESIPPAKSPPTLSKSLSDAFIDFTTTTEGKVKLFILLLIIAGCLYWYYTRFGSPKKYSRK